MVRSLDAEITGLDATIKRLRQERRRVAKQRELYVNRGSARAKLHSSTKPQGAASQPTEQNI